MDGEVIFDSHGRVSRVTTAGYGPSVGKQILMAYLPSALAEQGTPRRSHSVAMEMALTADPITANMAA